MERTILYLNMCSSAPSSLEHPEPFILRQYEGTNGVNREVTVLERKYGNRDELNIFIKIFENNQKRFTIFEALTTENMQIILYGM